MHSVVFSKGASRLAHDVSLECVSIGVGFCESTFEKEMLQTSKVISDYRQNQMKVKMGVGTCV